jgi:hypothetical protein
MMIIVYMGPGVLACARWEERARVHRGARDDVPRVDDHGN